MSFYHVLLPYATSRFMSSNVTPSSLLEVFRRHLDLFGIRPVEGSSHESVLERLLYEKFDHISELYPELAYQDCPAWDARSRPYEPDPIVLSHAQESFEEAKPWPAFEGDELDNIPSDLWDKLYRLGKPALLIYCRNHSMAVGVRTPVERGEVIRWFFQALQDRVYDIAKTPDFPRLLSSLRVPADDWPSAGQTPFGLLKRFSQEFDAQDRTFQIDDPVAWWHANEAYIPDLSERP